MYNMYEYALAVDFIHHTSIIVTNYLTNVCTYLFTRYLLNVLLYIFWKKMIKIPSSINRGYTLWCTSMPNFHQHTPHTIHNTIIWRTAGFLRFSHGIFPLGCIMRSPWRFSLSVVLWHHMYFGLVSSICGMFRLA